MACCSVSVSVHFFVDIVTWVTSAIYFFYSFGITCSCHLTAVKILPAPPVSAISYCLQEMLDTSRTPQTKGCWIHLWTHWYTVVWIRPMLPPVAKVFFYYFDCWTDGLCRLPMNAHAQFIQFWIVSLDFKRLSLYRGFTLRYIRPSFSAYCERFYFEPFYDR